MQTIRIKPPSTDSKQRARSDPGKDLTALLAGATLAVAGVGAVLALTDSPSPLRGPLTLFFLLAAPGAAIAAALSGLDPFGRILASLAGAVALDMLVAQAMLALHRWSVPGGVAAVAALSSLILLLTLVRRLPARTTRRRNP